MIKAKWIWQKTPAEKDCYVEFYEKFVSYGTPQLKISCDGIYAVFVNGNLAAFSGCADYPYYKFYDEFALRFVKRGVNELKIAVWRSGDDSLTYKTGAAGAIFELSEDGRILVFSNPYTKSRVMAEYKNGYEKKITSQLGYSFLYDATAVKGEYLESTVVENDCELHLRNIKPLELGGRVISNVVRTEKSVLIDLGRETVGFLDIEFNSPEQKILIAYGERLVGGSVARVIGDRDFSVEYVAKSGYNAYLNPFRRIAGRYLEIFAEKPIDIKYIGIRPVYYPIERLKADFGEALKNDIYRVAVDTLTNCMHEHYEDCPWREQALYTMDSRNQMLCGYYAFKSGNADYARHNLVLISKGLRPDGLLSLTFPGGLDFPIPSFSLYYLIEVAEYIRYTKDKSIIDEVGGAIKTIMDTFSSKIDNNGLIAAFPYPYWNFYEWADESANDWQITRKAGEGKQSYDLILNCLFVYAAGYYDEIFGEKTDTAKLRAAIEKTFKAGEGYKLSTLTERSSQLGNAMALLIGLGDEALAEKTAKCEDMIEATLSMRAFVYDALLKFAGKYEKFIIGDIAERYGKMLAAGATSFWETEKGAEDFGGAGSLCHGWSAIPVYYFNVIK